MEVGTNGSRYSVLVSIDLMCNLQHTMYPSNFETPIDLLYNYISHVLGGFQTEKPEKTTKAATICRALFFHS